MPNFIKTEEDERLWAKAKNIAKEDGKEENWAYITGIYKKMKGGKVSGVTAANEPTNKKLWSKAIAEAKKRFEKYPSAYANGWAVRWYNERGGGWRKEKKARGKSKKDVGHGGLDEWFSGHGKDKGDATWGDWVAISPVKKTLGDGKKVSPGDIVGPCGISKDPDWKDVTDGGKDPLKCMPRQKAHDTPKKERAELAKGKMKAEKSEAEKKKPTRTPTFKTKKGGEGRQIMAGKYDHINFKPPTGVANAAKRGLEYRQRQKGDKAGLTPSEAAKEGIGSGVQRAVNLKNRDTVSPKVIKQMKAFFSRHQKNKAVDPKHKGEPWKDKGYVSWLLWGGDPGKAWAEKVVGQMEAADKKKESSHIVAECYTMRQEGTRDELVKFASQMSKVANAHRLYLNLLGVLRALQWLHWTTHWKVRGSNFYGDHLLFQRLYIGDDEDESPPIEEIDTLGEKIIAYYGPDAINPAEQIHFEASLVDMWTRESNLLRRALFAEETLQVLAKVIFTTLEDQNDLPLGMNDYLAALANARETNVYLLKQRVRSMDRVASRYLEGIDE